MLYKQSKISIHALREEGDLRPGEGHGGREPISIHALREEGDSPRSKNHLKIIEFLSTPSARRATPSTLRASRLS